MKFTTIAALLLSPLALASPLEERQDKSCGSGITAAEASRVSNALRASGVIPTLVPTVSPKSKVNVAYGAVAMDLGTRTTSAQTALQPTFNFTAPAGDKASQRYSFFMVDPDVPGPNGLPVINNPRINFLHWYISNIPACGGAADGTLVTFYESPTPASPGDQHRYTWLVYREPAGYKANAISAQVRPAFDLLGYTTRAGLGDPVGANFMLQSITNT